MFVVVVCGGPYDGEKVGKDGWVAFYPDPVYRFSDYADAQEFIESRSARVDDGDYGVGAKLAIDEIDGDIYDCN
jgi:hypothetical protein